MERIREILFEAEREPVDPNDDLYSGYIDWMDKVTPEDAYQLALMRDAGFIDGRDATLGLFRVTNSGHDYLDAVRDEGVWKKTKEVVSEKGGSAALEIVKSLAIGFLKKQISNKTGMDL